MFKTATEIAEHTGLSFAQINLILCRSELYKYKTGRKYHITLDFIAEMYKYFQFKKVAKEKTEEKEEESEEASGEASGDGDGEGEAFAAAFLSVVIVSSTGLELLFSTSYTP